jgi:hypothetical protein
MGKLFGKEINGAALALMLDGWIGGQDGVTAVTAALSAGSDLVREQEARAERAETALELAQAELRRRREGRGQPEGTVFIADPPKGHHWVTGVPGGVAGPEADGRLVCAQCTGWPRGGGSADTSELVLAAQCWARNS